LSRTPRAGVRADFLEVEITDRETGRRLEQFFGGNFSSPLRDKTFYLDVPRVSAAGGDVFALGEFDAALHELAFADRWPGGVLEGRPAVAIAISERYEYRRTEHMVPGLGREYRANIPAGAPRSLTDAYFERLGFEARAFLPPAMGVPLRIMHMRDDRIEARSPFVLAALAGVMGPFQVILRGDIYRSRNKASVTYRFEPDAPFDEPPRFPPYDLAHRNAELGPRQAQRALDWVERHRSAIERTLSAARRSE